MQTPSSGLPAIVTAVATKLMGADARTATDMSTEILAELVGFLDVDVSFLRYNDHNIGATVLVAEWPQRPDKPDPDPLQTIYFADADPIFALCEHAKQPVVIRPESENEDYQRTINEARGVPAVSMAAVPLLSGDVTTGALGFVKFGDREWNQDELNTLTVVATMFAQVQARLKVEDWLRYQAEHDDLTALPNRRTLLSHLDRRLLSEEPGPVCVLLFDLDRLKVINDFLGHDAGDQFIRDFATRTTEAVAGQGFIARLSAGKLGVVPASAMDLDVATQLAENLSAQLTDHVTIDGAVLNRTVSIGVAVGAPGKDSSLDLLRHADEALINAKEIGGDRIGVFSRDMLTRRELRTAIQLDLAAAIDTQALSVVYLPEVDMLTGKVVAVEALASWEHPTRGLLLPDEFVPIAESINLATELGNWLLHAACADLAIWRAHGVGRDTRLRINVSPAQLVTHDLVDTLRRAIDTFGLDGASIGLEITENVLIGDLPDIRDILVDLAEMGVDIAIDHFGTGYGSLALLRTLPLGTLKIDRGFVSDLDTCADDLAIVRAIIGLAEALDLDVVAEGVETEGAAQTLVNEGCSQAQGFLFSPPITAAATQRLLAEGPIFLSFTVAAQTKPRKAERATPPRRWMATEDPPRDN